MKRKKKEVKMKCCFFIFAMMACSVGKTVSNTEDTASNEEEPTSDTELPTSSEIEEEISEANYCDVAEDCGFVDSCWCGAVANVTELEALQILIAEWKQDPVNADNCATTDCAPFSDISCEEGICVAIAAE
jgi:hypothetical protein